MLMRIGHGFDVHKLVTKEEYLERYPERINPVFKLAGVVIAHDKLLLGHSDADVVIHAISDALLGAAAHRDIGFHFPDTDENFAGIDSLILLKKVLEIIQADNYAIGNIDVTIMAQKPKLSPYIPAMLEVLAQALSIEQDQINIKATTTEKLGFVGREEGIACEAVVLLKHKFSIAD
jgi:2-C-methyl-D-erythritol 2,4-cyclodiphosphate synthase